MTDFPPGRCGIFRATAMRRVSRRSSRFVPGAAGVRCRLAVTVPTAPFGAVTELLRAWSDGDNRALDRLVPLVDAELRRLARGYMGRERREHTLQVTALVNEAFLRLTGAQPVRWQDRAH